MSGSRREFRGSEKPRFPKNQPTEFFWVLGFISLQIHYVLVVRSCECKEIFNYYWRDKLKLNYVWCGFFCGFFYPKNPVGFLGITQVSEAW